MEFVPVIAHLVATHKQRNQWPYGGKIIIAFIYFS